MEKQNDNDSQFAIDFFEYSFLLEACMPPAPIARTMMFKRSIDEDYYNMSDNQRSNLYKWLKPSIENIFDKMGKYDLELINIWLDRFNPENQYKVTTKSNEIIKAFKHKDLYHVKINTTINVDYIDNIEPLY